MPYQFYFYHDVIEPNKSAELDPGIRHRQLVVAHGQIDVGMQTVNMDQGTYFSGGGILSASSEGAWVWRCEIVEEGAAESLLRGDGVMSRAMMKKPINSIDLKRGEKWLFRSDTTTMFPGAVANRHVHEGPGIRCLKFGEFRVESQETTATYHAGEPWYETGPNDPVIARASATQPTSFVRIMLLPPKWFGLRSVKFVDPSSDTSLRGRSARRVYDDTIIEI